MTTVQNGHRKIKMPSLKNVKRQLQSCRHLYACFHCVCMKKYTYVSSYTYAYPNSSGYLEILRICFLQKYLAVDLQVDVKATVSITITPQNLKFMVIIQTSQLNVMTFGQVTYILYFLVLSFMERKQENVPSVSQGCSRIYM